MVEIVYLGPDEEMPDTSEGEPWLIIEASDDGRFFGSGRGRKPTGEDVGYASLAENDESLEAAIAAAIEWANERGVSRIWIQTTPTV